MIFLCDNIIHFNLLKKISSHIGYNTSRNSIHIYYSHSQDIF